MQAESQGIAVWCTDQAGPYQTKPYSGNSWEKSAKPAEQAHEYQRNGTAKLMTLFHPSSGEVRIEGVRNCPNTVLHPWLKSELSGILKELPVPQRTAESTGLADWEYWYEGLKVSPTRAENLPALRLILVLDNLAGHKSVEFVLWCFSQGIALLYTPLGGSWLNMAESIQRILKRRALDGQHPQTAEEIMQWFEEVAEGWNQDPTPFVWKGKKWRQRQRRKWYILGGSGACTRRSIDHWETMKIKWRVA